MGKQSLALDEKAAPTGSVSPPRHLFVRLLGVLALGVAGWLATTVNVADYFGQEDDKGSAVRALTWAPEHPRAAAVLAADAVANKRPEAMELLGKAADANPVSGVTYGLVALVSEAEGREESARQAMSLGGTLAPQRTDLSLTAYDFWLRRGDVERALRAANVALTRDKASHAGLFPSILALTARPGADAAFERLLADKVVWWPEFFRHATERAINVDVVRALHALQRSGPNSSGDDELRAYLKRLQTEGLWLDAYLVWLNSLPKDRALFSGELYNGGFEERSRNLGFEWLDQPLNGVLVGFDPSYGVTGSRALHVVFQGLRVRWRHFYQYLMLPPGSYTLRGRVRADSLQTERGVVWQVSCHKASEPIATSERFKGTDQWRHFSVGFQVPNSGCPVQELRLELLGRAALDYEASGQIWFDDLSLMRG